MVSRRMGEAAPLRGGRRRSPCLPCLGRQDKGPTGQGDERRRARSLHRTCIATQVNGMQVSISATQQGAIASCQQ